MLKAIEEMKFFLQMGFSDCKRFAGGGDSVKVQGLTQGNWAITCRVSGHQRSDLAHPWEEGAQRYHPMPYQEPFSVVIRHSLCQQHRPVTH